MKNFGSLFFALMLTVFAWSCGSDKSEQEDQDSSTIEIKIDSDKIQGNIDEGMDDLERGLEEMSAGIEKMVNSLTEDGKLTARPAADFRDLKALLPDRLLRMERTSHSGERSGIKGLQVAVAEAEYEDDDRYLEVKLVDGGGLPIASLANAGWSMVEVDKEDKNGFERTTTIDGHKAFEKYNEKWKEGELVVFYQERFIITLKGKGIDSDDLRRALDRIDLDELNEL